MPLKYSISLVLGKVPDYIRPHPKRAKMAWKVRLYYYCIYLASHASSTSKGSSPLWRFPHHIAKMNVFTPQAVLLQPIPTLQCSATPKNLSCTLYHPASFVKMLNSTYQLQFNPMKPHLYVAYRGCGTGLVCSWDICSDVDTPLEIFQVSSVAQAKSDIRTNQKMRFDIDIGGQFLSIGDQVRSFHTTHKKKIFYSQFL